MSGIHYQQLRNHWKVGWGHRLSLLVLVHSHMNAVLPVWKDIYWLKWHHRQQVWSLKSQQFCFCITESVSAITVTYRSLPFSLSSFSLQDLAVHIFHRHYCLLLVHTFLTVQMVDECSPYNLRLHTVLVLCLSFFHLTDVSGLALTCVWWQWLLLGVVEQLVADLQDCITEEEVVWAVLHLPGQKKHRYVANSLVWNKLSESS